MQTSSNNIVDQLKKLYLYLFNEIVFLQCHGCIDAFSPLLQIYLFRHSCLNTNYVATNLFNYSNAQIHTLTRALTHTHSYTHTITHTKSHTHFHTITHSLSHARTHTLTHAHSHSHTRTFTHTHSYTHTITHTLSHAYFL